MKLLITGFTGFVSDHFLKLLNEIEPGSQVFGIDKSFPNFKFSEFPNLTIGFQQVDLLDKDMVKESLLRFSPEYILHLASVSSVAASWETPLDSFVNNTNIFLNLVEQVRVNNIDCRILSIGSSEEYGAVSDEQLPLTEEHLLKPLSPYAVARVSQEMLSKIYADGFGQQIIITRSFNHIGPGQRENFVISSFVKQLVQLSKQNNSKNEITTGDLTIIRDFLDVRDVVKAYYILLKHGQSGEIYNICSGKGTMLKEIINKISFLLNTPVDIVTNPDLIRRNENRKIIGSYKKIKTELGWEPTISIDQSLNDIIEYWQLRIS